MDFATFLEAAEVKPTEVAKATGLHLSTITRIRDGQVPDGPTLLRLSRWADELRRRRRLPAAIRLSWDHLLDGGGAAA